MRITHAGLPTILGIAIVLTGTTRLIAQTSAVATSSGMIVGHPFTAIKFTHLVKVLPDGKRQFLRNERYPTRIARDSEGRLMMQKVHSDDLAPECDHLDLVVPPPCPVRTFVVIDPVAQKVTHWGDGENLSPGAVEFPLTPVRLKEAADSTSILPTLGPDFSDEDGKVSKVDLGNSNFEGVRAHGVRWTLRYEVNQNSQTVQSTRIYELWTSAEMQLIVRAIEGDPNGEETVWGLEKISLAPDAALFRPPEGYPMTHRTSDRWTGIIDHFIGDDFDCLHQWFAK